MRRLLLLLALVVLLPVVVAVPYKRTVLTEVTCAEETVYVTKTGEKYHRSGCGYLRQSKRAIELTEAKAAGYTPCSRCKPPR